MAARLPAGKRAQLIAQAHELSAAGQSLREIASSCGVSHPTVLAWLKKPKPEPRPVEVELIDDTPTTRAKMRIRVAQQQLEADPSNPDWLAVIPPNLTVLSEIAVDDEVAPAIRVTAAQTAIELALAAHRMTARLQILERFGETS